MSTSFVQFSVPGPKPQLSPSPLKREKRKFLLSSRDDVMKPGLRLTKNNVVQNLGDESTRSDVALVILTEALNYDVILRGVFL
ncbi:hypothetical protein NPIL_485901 [Nephila pilipes]|uniref:Uncharacterized protein n=1 Tax=Nephila pilipes TaxID=299642 RepID=A0A8X6NLT2_NEPPI|nr:hypothetical protein NPIL_485901 [Nephila pilipes]